MLLRPGADPQGLLRRALEAGAVIHRFELLEPRLHEIFVRHVTQQAARDGAAAAYMDGPVGHAIVADADDDD